MSVYALVDPEGAQSRRERAIDVARAGDFGTYRDRDSVRISWTIARLAEAAEAADDDPYPALLGRVPELLDRPERFRDLWAEEDAHLRASEDAITSGVVTIEEIEDLDLAVVTVPEDWATRTVHRFTISMREAVHPTALNNATDRFRVLVVHGHRYELQYRYETWVRYLARRPPGRVDLAPLAVELSALEPGDARWTFDGVGAIAPAQFRARVVEALRTGVSAWDPYA